MQTGDRKPEPHPSEEKHMTQIHPQSSVPFVLDPEELMHEPYDTLHRYLQQAQSQGESLTLSTGDPEGQVLSFEGQPVTATLHPHLISLHITERVGMNVARRDLGHVRERGSRLEFSSGQVNFTLRRFPASA